MTLSRREVFHFADDFLPSTAKWKMRRLGEIGERGVDDWFQHIHKTTSRNF
jgi:hypothetical protein